MGLALLGFLAVVLAVILTARWTRQRSVELLLWLAQFVLPLQLQLRQAALRLAGLRAIGGGVGWAFVQSSAGSPALGAGSGSGATVTLAFAANVTAGNLLVVGASASHTAGTPAPTLAVTDTRSNSYATDISMVDGTDFMTVALFSAIANGTGSCTVTLTITNANDGSSLCIGEFSGLASASRVDVTGQVGPTNVVTPTITTGTTGAANELVIGYWADTGNSQSPAAGTGFVDRCHIWATFNNNGTLESADSGGIGAQTITWTTAGTTTGNGVAAVYKLAGVAVGPGPGFFASQGKGWGGLN